MRVSEAEVARILLLIATEPNRRTKPRHGDPKRPFDYWFDGGAVSMLTQHIRYLCGDGTTAHRELSPQHLRLTIVFANHETVTITQA